MGSFSRCSQSRALARSDGVGGTRGGPYRLYERDYDVSLVLEGDGDAGGHELSTTPLLHFPNESANSPIRLSTRNGFAETSRGSTCSRLSVSARPKVIIMYG